MKLKIVFLLLFLAGSAYSQLITPRGESGSIDSYGDASPLTFTLSYDRPATTQGTQGRIPASLTISLRDNFSATSTVPETQGFGASLHAAGLHPFAAESVPAAAETSPPTALDLALLAADSRAQSDPFPINQDQGVLALIAAASTVP